MNALLQNNKIRHSCRLFLALLLALYINYFYADTSAGWLPLATVLVMLTPTGSALYQGLMRYLLIACFVAIISLLFSSKPLFYERESDVALGALIGIVVNLIFLPDKVDAEFRKTLIPILQSYAVYFAHIIKLVLKNNDEHVELAKAEVEKNLLTIPNWVFNPGFDLRLQKSYCYFALKTIELGEILFALHHVARYSFQNELLAKIAPLLLPADEKIQPFFLALTTVLDLRKLSEGVVEFSDEIKQLDEIDKSIPLNLALLDIEKDHVYFRQFVRDLKDFHDALLKLASSLR